MLTAVPLAAAAALWLVLVRVVPLTRYLMVVQGASTTSSWSMPIMLAPFLLNTPTTRKETFLMRSSLPMGDSPWNSSRLMVVPTTHTLLALRTSASVNISPSSKSSHSCTFKKLGATPLMNVGTQLRLP